MPTAKLDVCAIEFEAANPDGVICHFVRKVTQASLLREVATRASKRLAMRLTEGVFCSALSTTADTSSVTYRCHLLPLEKATVNEPPTTDL